MAKNYVAEALKGVEQIKQQVKGYEDTTSLLRINTERIEPICTSYIVTSNVVASDIFKLSTNNGILGTNRLGMYYDASNKIRIGSPNDVFKERFVHTDFIVSSDTTASINTDTNNWGVVFADDILESVISDRIYYDQSQTYGIDGVTLEVTGTNTGGATYLFSTDGITWVEVEPNVYKPLTRGYELWYRINNSSGSSTAPWGSPWGTAWATDDVDSVTINELKITYVRT